MDRKRETGRGQPNRTSKRFSLAANRANTKPKRDNAQLKHPAPKSVQIHNPKSGTAGDVGDQNKREAGATASALQTPSPPSRSRQAQRCP